MHNKHILRQQGSSSLIIIIVINDPCPDAFVLTFTSLHVLFGPSFWPRFDCVAREVLLNCRYRIEVPNGESVFEYFFTTDKYLSLQTTLLTSHITPKVWQTLCSVLKDLNI